LKFWKLARTERKKGGEEASLDDFADEGAAAAGNEVLVGRVAGMGRIGDRGARPRRYRVVILESPLFRGVGAAGAGQGRAGGRLIAAALGGPTAEAAKPVVGRHRVLGADFVNDVDPVATEQRLERQRRHGRLGVVARGTGGSG